MPAGYVRVWLSMETAIDHIMRIAGCGRQEARDALIEAILDGEIRSRFGDNGLQAIKAFLWENARYWAPYSGFGARNPNRVTINGDPAYLRPYFDPPPDPSLLPERMRPVEIRREDVERFWPLSPALGEPRGPPERAADATGKYQVRDQSEAAAFSRTSSDSLPAKSPASGRSGRKKGSGSFDDTEHLGAMLRLLKTGRTTSVYAAARTVADAITTSSQSRTADIARLRRKFARRYGTEPAEGKSWIDIEAELDKN